MRMDCAVIPNTMTQPLWPPLNHVVVIISSWIMNQGAEQLSQKSFRNNCQLTSVFRSSLLNSEPSTSSEMFTDIFLINICQVKHRDLWLWKKVPVKKHRPGLVTANHYICRSRGSSLGHVDERFVPQPHSQLNWKVCMPLTWPRRFCSCGCEYSWICLKQPV